MKKGWKQLDFKDQTQYVMAIALIVSGIVIAFISFFMIHNIGSGVLIYIAQAFVAGGSVFGVSIYFNRQLGEFKSDATKNIIDEITNQIVRKYESKG